MHEVETEEPYKKGHELRENSNILAGTSDWIFLGGQYDYQAWYYSKWEMCHFETGVFRWCWTGNCGFFVHFNVCTSKIPNQTKSVLVRKEYILWVKKYILCWSYQFLCSWHYKLTVSDAQAFMVYAVLVIEQIDHIFFRLLSKVIFNAKRRGVC